METAKRDCMRKPQEWVRGHYGDYWYCHIINKKALHVCRVDYKNLHIVTKYRWYWKDGYAVTSIKGKRIKMHRLIMGESPIGKEVDHINRNRLDNRHTNLRWASSLQNGQNKVSVGVRKRGNLWEANLCLNYKKLYKSFKTQAGAISWRKLIKSRFIDHLAENKPIDDFFNNLLK